MLLKEVVLGNVSNNKALCIGTYGVLSLVSAIMTILNIITKKGYLTLSTAVFAILCILCIAVTLLGEAGESFAKVLFAGGIVFLFSFFLVSGNPEGFSAIWICMLPSLGMFFFGRYKGTAICTVMFCIMAFFLWVPYGQSLLMYNYTATFKMRFPVLFVAFHLLAFLLETLRVLAYNETKRLQSYYKDLSVKDQLTGMLNRQGMYSMLESDETYKSAATLGVAMFDIDHFKRVNDDCGHNMGDEVLKEFSKIVKATLNSDVCRWGGEEFVVIFKNNELGPQDFKKVCDSVEQFSFQAEGFKFHITASVGVCVKENFDVDLIDNLIACADEALYYAKNTGRNKIVYYEDL